MTSDLFEIQIALFYSTKLGVEDKLDYARKSIVASGGLFKTEKQVEVRKPIEGVEGSPWLVLTNNGITVSVADSHINFSWLKQRRDDSKTPEVFMQEVNNLVEYFSSGRRIVRAGLIRTFLLPEDVSKVKKTIFSKNINSSFSNFQAVLLDKVELPFKNLRGNLRYEIEQVQYITRDDSTSKEGVGFRIDINSQEDVDADLSSADIKHFVHSILDEYTYEIIFSKLNLA
jgi:hypothetical protein